MASTLSTESSLLASSQLSLPWVERYRPSTLPEFIHRDSTSTEPSGKPPSASTKTVMPWQMMMCLAHHWVVRPWDMKHLLLHGPPGVGKTSFAHALVGDICKHDRRRLHLLAREDPTVEEDMRHIRYHVKVMDASMDRSVGNMRTELSPFVEMATSVVREEQDNLLDASQSQQQALEDDKESSRKRSMYFLILDEADLLTPAAQALLPAWMDTRRYHALRIIMITNHLDSFLPLVTSHCVTIHFPPLPALSVIQQLTAIASKQCLHISIQVMETIIALHSADLRACIAHLQYIYHTASSSMFDRPRTAVSSPQPPGSFALPAAPIIAGKDDAVRPASAVTVDPDIITEWPKVQSLAQWTLMLLRPSLHCDALFYLLANVEHGDSCLATSSPRTSARPVSLLHWIKLLRAYWFGDSPNITRCAWLLSLEQPKDTASTFKLLSVFDDAESLLRSTEDVAVYSIIASLFCTRVCALAVSLQWNLHAIRTLSV